MLGKATPLPAQPPRNAPSRLLRRLVLLRLAARMGFLAHCAAARPWHGMRAVHRAGCRLLHICIFHWRGLRAVKMCVRGACVARAQSEADDSDNSANSEFHMFFFPCSSPRRRSRDRQRLILASQRQLPGSTSNPGAPRFHTVIFLSARPRGSIRPQRGRGSVGECV